MATKPPIILVVDDDAHVAGLAAQHLEGVASEVLTCHDAEAALGLIQSRSDIDLVFADIRLPAISGAELAQKLRTLRPGLAVVLTSAYPEAPTGIPFVPKPWRRDALRALIRYHLGM
jgi:CheY-like chemotaxis protein